MILAFRCKLGVWQEDCFLRPAGPQGNSLAHVIRYIYISFYHCYRIVSSISQLAQLQERSLYQLRQFCFSFSHPLKNKFKWSKSHIHQSHEGIKTRKPVGTRGSRIRTHLASVLLKLPPATGTTCVIPSAFQ